MPRLIIELTDREYAQLRAFAEGLKITSSPLVDGAVTIERLAPVLMMRALDIERITWYREQANLDPNAMAVLERAVVREGAT